MGINIDQLIQRRESVVSKVSKLKCGKCSNLVQDVKELKGCKHLFCKLRVQQNSPVGIFLMINILAN